MRRQKRTIVREGVARVDEQKRAAIRLGADDAPRRLQHLAHAGVLVSIAKSALVGLLIGVPQHIPLQTELRQADADDHRAAEPLGGQVDSLGKHAAHDRETDGDSLAIRLKLIQKRRPRRVVHLGRLLQQGNLRQRLPQ